MSPRRFLKLYQERLGLTQQELAVRLDYDSGNLSRLMSRPNYEIRATTALRFAKRLGVTVEQLMGVHEWK